MKKYQLHDIDPKDKANHVSIFDVYLGGRTIGHLVKEPFKDKEIEIRFRSDCLNVLLEVSTQIKKRFTLEPDSVLAKLKILDPKISTDVDKSPDSIVPLAIHFPAIIPECELDELDDEWRSYRVSGNEVLNLIESENIPKYWHFIRTYKNESIEIKYLRLSNFMTSLTVLPHSLACVESIFSSVNCIKDKTTSSLKVKTVTDRILAKQCVERNGKNCTTWTPPRELRQEMISGKIHQRYKDRLAKDQAENTVNVYPLPENSESLG